MITVRNLLTGIFALALAATTLNAQTPVTPPPSAPPAAPPATSDLPDSPGASIPVPVVHTPTGSTAIFDTSMGRMTCKFFDKEAPNAVANFIGLTEGTKEWTDPVTGEKVKGKSYYNGTTFHRVIPGFMVQGGDRKGDGTGDAGFYFANETSPGLTFDVAGRLAMANAGADTNGTQFFITEVPYPDLDGKYTIFGQCDAHSVLIAATMARVERDSSDKPRVPVTLDKITIVREGQPIPPPPVLPVAVPTPVPPPPTLVPRP